ncbi:DUF4173 domain-containing protein [Patescibacteria group bacterium]|nr:MAG: DUF4173 domain-containing protein [Patescibacteria group bacterium]
MAFDLSAPHPHHKAHLVVATMLTAFAATLAFHFLLIPSGHGFGFVLFAAVLIAGMLVLAVMSSKPLNTWAFLFLVPVAFTLAAETLYASDVVAALGFLITFVSLTFFSYWLTVPRLRFDEVQSLWPRRIVPEVLFPVRGTAEMLTTRSGKRDWTPVLGGVVLAIPFLIVIGALFAGADPLFRKGIEGVFDDVDLARTLFRLCRDAVALLFFLGGGWLLLTRAIEGRKPSTAAHDASLDRTVVMTFLGLLNALFVVFLAFQTVTFFGGQAFVESQGLTYAEYARQGFFQLLAVAGIVFGVIWAIYRQTELRQWGTRGLSLLLIAQTGVVIVSAINRLLLYIDAYGLSVSRYWALVTIGIIAAVLVSCFVGALAKVKYHDLAKYAFPGVLVVVSALLLFNVEGFVVRFNAERILSGKTDRLDVPYMLHLSADAVPTMAEFACAEVSPFTTASPNEAFTSRFSCERLKAVRPGVSGQIDWRRMTVSAYRAQAAIAGVKQ